MAPPSRGRSINGTRRILRDISSEVNKFLVIRYYQPPAGLLSLPFDKGGTLKLEISGRTSAQYGTAQG